MGLTLLRISSACALYPPLYTEVNAVQRGPANKKGNMGNQILHSDPKSEVPNTCDARAEAGVGLTILRNLPPESALSQATRLQQLIEALG